MKKLGIFALTLTMILSVACGGSENVSKEAGELLPTGSEVDSVSYLVGTWFGSMIKGNNLGKLNKTELRRGMRDFINAEGEPAGEEFLKQFKVNPMEMNRIMNSFIGKRMEYTKQVNADKEAVFFKKVAKIAGIEKTESGIYYLIDEEGEDRVLTDDDQLFVHYKGTLPNGNVFDEVKEDAASACFKLSQVISGWKEGMKLIGNGGKIKLYIPSELAYGERGTRGIEPCTPLTFDVQIDSVHYAAPAETEKEVE